MKKNLTIIVAVIAAFTALMLNSPAQSATTKPVYAAPTGVYLANTGDQDLQVRWNPSPYADYYVVKYADNSGFNNPGYFRENDYPNDITLMGNVNPLEENTKYWFKVAVVNHEGVRLSPYSSTKTGTTECDPEGGTC